MSTIVTRSSNGAALTHTQMDANFTNLNNDKYQSGNSPYFANMYLGAYLYHNGDTNTYLGFTAADDARLVVGGRQALRMDEGSDPDSLQLCSGASGGATLSTTGRFSQHGGITVVEQWQSINTNYTVTNGLNAMSIGPTTISSGVTVTVGDGEAWTVV